mmetsp:Transcript_13598/g.31968  ORF Transcript_13598/g.31968 Transcript_13598/m.31968 type:complete len:257 (-) Transcript_13598:1799-2569(-)
MARPGWITPHAFSLRAALSSQRTRSSLEASEGSAQGRMRLAPRLIALRRALRSPWSLPPLSTSRFVNLSLPRSIAPRRAHDRGSSGACSGREANEVLVEAPNIKDECAEREETPGRGNTSSAEGETALAECKARSETERERRLDCSDASLLTSQHTSSAALSSAGSGLLGSRRPPVWTTCAAVCVGTPPAAAAPAPRPAAALPTTLAGSVIRRHSGLEPPSLGPEGPSIGLEPSRLRVEPPRLPRRLEAVSPTPPA